MTNPEKKIPVQLQLDEQVAQGTYSNLVIINHSDNEFVFDFAFLQPSAPLANAPRCLPSPIPMAA